MICPICKEVIKDESKFCGKCGSMIPRCPTCGRVITKKSKFCTSDGTPLPEDIIALFETVSDETKQEKNVHKKKRGLFSLLTAFFVIIFLGISITAGYSYLYEEYPWETILSFIDRREQTDTLDTQKQKEGQKQENIWTSTSEASEQKEIVIEEVPPTETETESFVMESSETEISPETEEDMRGTVPAVSMNNITTVTATSSLSEHNMTHLPSRAIDGDLSTAWVEGVSGQGVGESIHFIFDDNYMVSGLIIHAGYQKSDSHYRKNSRPKEILIEFYDGDSETYTLQDIDSEQNIEFRECHITNGIAIYIQSVYEGDTYQDTCISEVSIY